MKLMATHTSATARTQAPHVNRTTRTNTIMNALTQRARAVLNDSSLDAESRVIIRHALETNDPWLAKRLRNEEETNHEKIEALADIICREGEEAAAALFVLM